MNLLPLTLGPIATHGFQLYRSGIRWLCEDGHLCRPDEVVAFCNVVVDRSGGVRLGPAPFADERELQIAVAPRVGGRLKIADGLSHGGYLDIVGVVPWDPDTLIGHIETASADPPAAPLRLLMLAGRRMSELADVHTGLLPGWHSRARGWWADGPGRMLTMLSLGLCDVTGIARGSRSAFTEMFEATREPTQIVHVPDHPIAPSARVLLDQLTRTPEEYQAIVVDLMQGLTDRGTVPRADDLMFAGTLLSSLQRSPIRDTYDVLTPLGLRREGPADVLLLSLSAESNSMLRHKKLGYTVHILRHHQAAVGPAARAWLRSAFEPVRRTADDVRHDYRLLLDAVGEATGARILILNRMSTSGVEDISSYASFEHPMSESLANIATKELNLMLHDLAEERDFDIVDLDAITAELGAAHHLPDGIHPSGSLLAVLRTEIMHILDGAPAA
jgi:hypothetical protein